MKPVLTQKARKSKPQYLDQYIKHKMSLESVPETSQSSRNLPKPKGLASARGGSNKKGATLTTTKSQKQLFATKYTVNEKSVQSSLLSQMRSALHPQQH